MIKSLSQNESLKPKKLQNSLGNTMGRKTANKINTQNSNILKKSIIQSMYFEDAQ